jgi:hypothetical protein
MPAKPLSPQQLRKLPWPPALLGQRPLTAREAYGVGKLIVDRAWQGRFDRGHQRKHWSVRRLHDTLGVGSPARFTRCVQVYEMVNELKLGAALDSLAVSTLFLVAGLDKAVRKKIAQRALKEGWSKGRLEREIHSSVGPRRFGRPQGPAFLRSLSLCAKEPMLKDLERLESLDAASLRAAGKQADRLLRDLQRLKQALIKG